MKRINLNSEVYVKLTRMGYNILEREYEKTINDSKMLKDVTFKQAYDIQNGVLRMTLWKFMETFGQYFNMGQLEYPIEDLNLYINENDIKQTM